MLLSSTTTVASRTANRGRGTVVSMWHTSATAAVATAISASSVKFCGEDSRFAEKGRITTQPDEDQMSG